MLRKLWQATLGYERRRQFVRSITGEKDIHWTRVVMYDKVREIVDRLRPAGLDVLEISGKYWENKGFKSYTSPQYPEFDVCAGPLNRQFDLIIAEQVLEHVLWPYRAVKHVYQMLKPGGHFLVSTPFLLRIHNEPIDCSRWTELGMKHLLAEGGFPINKIETGSWGNRDCVRENLKGKWVKYRSRFHSLKNEPDYPVVVWALAEK